MQIRHPETIDIYNNNLNFNNNSHVCVLYEHFHNYYFALFLELK